MALEPWVRVSPRILRTRAFLRCCWMSQASRIANTPALQGIQNALKQRPAAFFTDEKAALVEAGNFDDDLDKIAECDWIIEAIVENLDAKRALWRKVDAARKLGTILSTNTSGIPLAKISEGFSPEFRRHFLGTHFFNPPRYLHLMELIPGPDTDPKILADVEEFADRRLGKGVVRTKDTPNFIANRIGSFLGGTVGKAMVEDDFSIEEVDALTGSLIGVPKSASFRLLDLVGLDVWAFVGTNLYELVPSDPWRERFLPLDFEKKMIERKWLGDKTGQGFYKRVGKEREIHALNWKTLEYQPQQKPRFASVEVARNIEDLGERVRTLLRADDRAGRFLWKVLSDYFLYCAEMIPEISDRSGRNRPRHALGLRAHAGSVRIMGRRRFSRSGVAPGNGTAAATVEHQKRAGTRHHRALSAT